MILAANDIKPTLEKLMLQLSELPALPQQRKNIFQIAGFPRRELVNSNMLAFYLDKDEEHGFGALFFESLLQLINAQVDLTDTEYEVYREFDFIDIVIGGKKPNEPKSKSEEFDWAIIIENKIYHNLNNNLKEYWKRVKVKNDGFKTGIVLSPYGHDEAILSFDLIEQKEKKKVAFSSITHKDLTDQVQKNLFNVFLQADDRHILFLKDYINNIESMYSTDEDLQMQDERLSFLQKNAEHIKKILTLNTEVQQYVLNETIKVMIEFGYEPNSTYFSTTGKIFLKRNDADVPDYFRFYIWYPSLVENEELNIHFELDKNYLNYGEALHKNDQLQDLIKSYRYARIDNSKGNGYYHLIHFQDSSFKDFGKGNSFSKYFREFMNNHFFNKDNGLLWKCSEIMEQVIKKHA